MNTYAEKFIAQDSLTELDLCFPFYDEDSNESNEVLLSSKVHSDVPSLAIDNLITVLNELKEKGAERIYITTHEDHQGYFFYGVNLIKL
jgi:hypothetical protein